MAWQIFDLKKEDGVAIATMTRDPGNTYNLDLMHELDEVIEDIRFDTDVKVVVLTGGGEKFFSAGADINMLNTADPRYKQMFCLHCNETLQELERIPKLVIAAADGHCVGGGLEIALACDMRVMGKTAGIIGLPEVSLGVLPGTGGSQRLPRLIGKGRALELMVTGKLLKPEQAEEIGLINHAVDGSAREYAINWAKELAQGATMAQGLIKLAVQEGIELPLNGGLALERELQNRLFASSDAREGISAYVEKRKPNFQGS
jgi:enoyl-CoA hydratase/carnithine racemase